MSLPSPSSTFTIPSVHDDVELDCRLYYPRYQEQHKNVLGRVFAIIAHPYAPLGGCYDDPVVASIGCTLLHCGITVGTFNFRGANGSGGRTSWTGRAELGDYVSFYGFMLCCISIAQIDALHEHSKEQSRPSTLILAGYSYGSMIASCLPSGQIVQSIFSGPAPGSAEAEIRSRAQKTGRDLSAYFTMVRNGSIGRGRSSLRLSDADKSPSKRGVALGGYDSEAASRRISRESSRKSFDGERVRMSLDRTRQRIRAHLSSEQERDISSVLPKQQDSFVPSDPALAFLLISPLLGPISMATTMFSKPLFERKDSQSGRILVKDTQPHDDKFMHHPACFIFGNKDVFTSSRKLRRWIDCLPFAQSDHSLVSSYEVDGASHFWAEQGAVSSLQANIRNWLQRLPSISEETQTMP